MSRSRSRKRPWLAALLAVFLTGFGHLYLRRWRRAIGWLAASFAVSVLFVDPEAVEELMAGTASPETMLAVSPMLFVVALSAADAYLLARAQNAEVRRSATADAYLLARAQNAEVRRSATADGETDDAETAGGDTIDCPHCGKELDPDLEFCHWCTKAVDADADRFEESPDR